MDRREFLKQGIVFAAGAWAGTALAQAGSSGPPQLPLLVNVFAGGGWDPPAFIDPKGSPTNLFALSAVTQAGPFSVAPLIAQANSFFVANASRLTVVNGIAVSTNGHRPAQDMANTGDLTASALYPTLPALYVAHNAPQMGLGYISNSNYNDCYLGTGGEVNVTYGTQAVVDALIGAASAGMVPASVQAVVDQAVDARLARLMARQHAALPLARMGRLRDARAGTADFGAVAATYNDVTAAVPVQEPTMPGLFLQLKLALVGYKHGITLAVNAEDQGYFVDSHAQHDLFQYPALERYFGSINWMLRAASYLGIDKQIMLVGLSEFGRTPTYNAAAGKDHWQVTSMFAMGPKIAGGRLVGSTDAGYNALKVDPMTLAPSDTGILIGQDHVQAALRAAAGLTGAPLAQKYPVTPARYLPLFG